MSLDGFNMIILVSFLIAVVMYAFYVLRLNSEIEGFRVYSKPQKNSYIYIGVVLLICLIVKLVAAGNFAGYDTDMSCFNAWSQMAYDNGLNNFYYLDAFTDYPPGYMALLWVVAAIRNIFSVDYTGTAGIVLIKMFPVIADVIAGFFVYKIARKKFSEWSSIFMAVIYVLNPVVVLDSSVWGQVDGVFTLFVLMTTYFCMEQKRILAYFIFVIGVLLKPQTLIFAPILIFTIIEQVFLKEFSVKKMVRDLIGGLAAIATMVILTLPFGIEKVFNQYFETLGSYEYCTINAYNFWALLGKNWASQDDAFLFTSCKSFGTIFIFVSVLLGAFVFFKLKDDKSKYFSSMAVTVSTLFLFSVRMHERYLFPVVILTLVTFLLKPKKQTFGVFAGFSVVTFLNVAHVYYTHDEFNSTGPQGGILGITALLTMCVFGYMFYAIFSKGEVLEDLKTINFGKKKKSGFTLSENYIVHKSQEEKKEKEKPQKWLFRPTKDMPKFTKLDWIVLGSIVVVYSIVAFVNLGNTKAPETNWKATNEANAIVLDLGEPKAFDKMYTYLGNFENRNFTLDVSNDNVNYSTCGKVSACSVFCWNPLKNEQGADNYNLADSYRYIRLTAQDYESVLNELVLLDKSGAIITPVNVSEYPNLFDEQDCFDVEATLMSGTYFDEIYHGRTGYEMTQGTYCYENTHPPLGKYIISLGIRIFGMNPFGWRFPGVLFGIIMLPLMYLLGRRLFKARVWAAGALCGIFAFDFMHFVQTRICTIDTYGTFFIIAMYFFMFWYFQTNFYDRKLWKTFIPLGACAVMMGLGCAAKWTAVYASVGLAIMFFVIMAMRFLEYRRAKANPKGTTNGFSHKKIIKEFPKKFWLTIAFAFLFFVLIAGLIYILSYIPFSDGLQTNAERFNNFTSNISWYDSFAKFLTNHSDSSFWNLFGKMFKNQYTMFDYHSKLEATHPYSSTWDQWPTMIKPMFYYSHTTLDGLKEGISAFGNPLVWWAGIPASVYMMYLSLRYKDKVAIFTCFSYIVQMVPWMLVPRCTFAYHYFPSVPFVCIAVVYCMVRMYQKNKKWLKWIFIYLGLALFLFFLFYPVLSGMPIHDTFARDGLKWLSTWALVA